MALVDLHALGVVVRDVKPGNLLVLPSGAAALADLDHSLVAPGSLAAAHFERHSGSVDGGRHVPLAGLEEEPSEALRALLLRHERCGRMGTADYAAPEMLSASEPEHTEVRHGTPRKELLTIRSAFDP